MPTYDLNLRVGDGAGGSRALSATDFATDATGAASQTTLAAVLTELAQKLEPSDLAGLATAGGQAALLAELGQKLEPADLAGLATQTTLASVLAKLPSDPATQTTLAAVLAKLSADPATQTTLAAVAAKLNAGIAITGSPDLRYSGGKLAVSNVLAASGDTAIATPAAGKAIRLVWIAFVPNGDNTAANLVTVKLGALRPYTGYALAHWEAFTGPVDAPLILNLANAQPVAYSAHYQEV